MLVSNYAYQGADMPTAAELTTIVEQRKEFDALPTQPGN
jgi:hypothetical protein